MAKSEAVYRDFDSFEKLLPQRNNSLKRRHNDRPNIPSPENDLTEVLRGVTDWTEGPEVSIRRAPLTGQ
jgi:hypothetical protein